MLRPTFIMCVHFAQNWVFTLKRLNRASPDRAVKRIANSRWNCKLSDAAPKDLIPGEYIP